LTQLRADTTRPAPSTVRIVVVGEIDLATAPTLHGRLLTVLHEQAPAVLVIDLAEVTFLDCAGIGMLVAARNTAIRAGGQVRISQPQPTVRRLLDMLGLLGILTAPIDQPQRESAHPSRGGPSPAHVTLRRGMNAAA
jgi:anti-anti-sigma factor